MTTSYSLNQLRNIARESSLNEAYQGREQVRPIAEVMKKIERAIVAVPYVDIGRDPLGAELDNALIKVFGFKSAHVWWNTDPEEGPCTITATRIMRDDTQHLAYGSFKNGFYDSKHTMTVFIQMTNNLVTEAHCTPDEMTAILLHEIGHNFDYTPFALMGTWYDVIAALISAISTLDPKVIISTVTSIPFMVVLRITPEFRRIYMDLMDLNGLITSAIPSIKKLWYGLDVITTMVHKIMGYIMTPINATLSIPNWLFFAPVRYMINFFLRKSETYADSLAATYGYGPEVATGLDKTMMGTMTFNNAPRGVFTIFDNILMLYQELFTLAYGGHGSTQQRTLRMIDSLKRDLNDPRLDAATRKACKTELARLEKTYKEIISLDYDHKFILTNIVRQLVNQWYAGTTPDLMHIVLPEYTYAK